MAAARGARRGAAGGKALVSARLLAVLEIEVAALERAVKDCDPMGVESAAGSKGRVEVISQITRTLEKLLELKRLEALAAAGGEEADSAETLRLRDEMMKRLRALDARREGGPGLFGADGTLGGRERPERGA